MPLSPKTPCSKCGTLKRGRCPKCEKERLKRLPRRHDYQDLYNTTAWRRARLAFLAENPYCVECEKQGRDRLAEHVDHIVPHKGDLDLFWDQENWQPLCRRCSNRKTAIEDGGFGRPDEYVI